MSYYNSIYFMDANSPIMEQMIFFHDYIMMFMISILIFMILNINMIMKFNDLNLNLNENQIIEIIWTVIPIFILIFIAMPSLHLLYIMEEFFNSSMTIKIIGHQWYWSYEYSDFMLKFDAFMSKNKMFRLLETDCSIYIPMNNIIRLLITSSDVIHSWTIQTLGLKMDAVPGRLNQMFMLCEQSGLFFGQCSEICGANHSFMPISVKVTNMSMFINWLKFMK